MIKLLSLFSGIGAFESALCRGGYQFETVNYCEIDPYASKAYSQIHGISEDYNLKDVRQVNTLLMDNINLMTWGWPCQDISVAGKQRGFKDNDGNLTRSGLFFQGLRILTELQPEYAIAENVKALTGKKFTAEFETVLTSLDKAGYNNYWKVLNAKDYGVPQNRERIFIISIRKDIDTGAFTFPEKQELKLRVKDVLEPVVDEKYYIDNERSRNLIRQITAKFDLEGVQNQKSIGTMVLEPKIKNIGSINGHQSGNVLHHDSDLSCLCVAGHVEPLKIMQPVIVGSTQIPMVIDTELVTIKRLGNLYDENAGGARAGNVYAPNGLAPALRTAQGGNGQPLIVQKDNWVVEPINPHEDETARTLKAQYFKNSVANFDKTGTYGATGVCKIDKHGMKIRKLTPRECFRLMGFSDADFDKIKGISNTQLYKMAGNSIVVNVLEAIFRQLFKENHKSEN